MPTHDDNDPGEDKPEPIIDAQLEDVHGGIRTLRGDVTVSLYGNDTLNGFTADIGNDTIPFEALGGDDILLSTTPRKTKR